MSSIKEIKKLYDNKNKNEFRGFGYELPGFITHLFENEINKIKINLIKNIAKDHQLNEEELINKYITNINFINKNLEKIQITKKREYCNNKKNNDLCVARVFNNGNGARCKRTFSKEVNYKNDNGNYQKICLCHIHYNVFNKNNNLEYGLYSEQKPSIFTNKNPKKESEY
jgi:hypothetical protein